MKAQQEAVTLEAQPWHPGDRELVVRLDVRDPGSLGCRATLRLEIDCRVHVDGRKGHGWTGIAGEVQLALDGPQVTARIPVGDRPVYGYGGRSIDIVHRLWLVVDGGAGAGRPIEAEIPGALPRHLARPGDDGAALEPPDAVDYARSVQALRPADKLRVAGAWLLVAVSVVGCGVFVRDWLVPEADRYFFPEHGWAGDGAGLLRGLAGIALLLASVAGLVVGFALQRILRLRYLELDLVAPGKPIRRGESILAASLLRGQARLDLDGLVVRIVAGNVERGEIDADGRSAFSNPCRAVVLFEQAIGHLPRGARIETRLRGPVSFDAAYDSLLPALMVGDGHGVDLVWKVVVMHPHLPDHVLAGPASAFAASDFAAPDFAAVGAAAPGAS